jgi:hypothetical protein
VTYIFMRLSGASETRLEKFRTGALKIYTGAK